MEERRTSFSKNLEVQLRSSLIGGGGADRIAFGYTNYKNVGDAVRFKLIWTFAEIRKHCAAETAFVGTTPLQQ
jgi:hypothetical protein